MRFGWVRGLGALGVVAACGHAKMGEPTAVGKAKSTPVATSTATALLAEVPKFDLKQLCSATSTGVATILANTKPFSRALGKSEGDWATSISKPPTPRDRCFVAASNIQSLEAEARAGGGGSLGARSSVPTSSSSGSSSGPTLIQMPVATKVSVSSEPEHLAHISRRFNLTESERGMLTKNGFVVLDRIPYLSYAAAYHDVFQEQLPLFVGIDPILHAAAQATEGSLESVEHKTLVPALRRMLTKLRRSLAQGGAPDNVIRDDLDVLLGFAWHYAKDDSQSGPDTLFGQDAEIERLAANESLTTVTMFGRERVIDFSQLVPRGHYASLSSEPLQNYFRAMMWLSRLELNLVSRDCRSSHPGDMPDPEETPREAKVAMALAELFERSGALTELAVFERTYTTFAGGREDVSMPELLARMKHAKTSARDANGPALLRAEIGDAFRRTARVHFMPQGVREGRLPVITTVFGPRIVPDIQPLTALVNDSVAGRFHLGAADVAYVLGHDSARSHLAGDIAAFPGLAAALDTSRKTMREGPRRDDLYGLWMNTVLAIGYTPQGTVPRFMGTPAYGDARANSALVAFGQLRHAYVLLAGQGYDSFGCEIPDGYVEPLVEVYDALIAQMRRVREFTHGSDRFERVLSTLRTIAARELLDQPLTRAQVEWLGMVSEYTPRGGYATPDECFDSCAPPQWTGWYFDLFGDRHVGATKATHFVADYFTLTNEDRVAHLGAEGPRMAVFLVGPPGRERAMVGPVAKGYEVHTAIAERLDDARALEVGEKRDPWRKSYAAADVPEPALSLQADIGTCETESGVECRVVLTSPKTLGPLSFVLQDHHGDALTEVAHAIHKGGSTVLTFTLPASFRGVKYGVEAVHLHIDDLAHAGVGRGPYDYATTPAEFWSIGEAAMEKPLPARPSGAKSFQIGIQK